jgi:hypothetical protein
MPEVGVSATPPTNAPRLARHRQRAPLSLGVETGEKAKLYDQAAVATGVRPALKSAAEIPIAPRYLAVTSNTARWRMSAELAPTRTSNLPGSTTFFISRS